MLTMAPVNSAETMGTKYCRGFPLFLMIITIQLAIFLIISMISLEFFNGSLNNKFLWQNKTSKTFLISSWTPHLFYMDQNHFSGSKSFDNCLYKNCIISFNRTLVNQSNLIIFEWDAIPRGKVDLPSRSDNQLWAFLTLESPATDDLIRGMERYSKYDKMFDLTITYRTDSTIYMPYFLLNLRKRDMPKDFKSVEAIAKKKTKIAAWFVSGVIDLSGRWKIVLELNKHGVSVDKFGKNQKLHCSRSDDEKCIKMLETDYKFYLAFENSICKDYISEKLFKVLPIHVVPVVLGGGNYRSILPKEAYIDALDFNSTKDLAEYLINLDKNDEKYMEYLSWRCKYDLQMHSGIQAAFCNICQKLNEDTLQPDLRTTVDMKKWWFSNKCLGKEDRFHRDEIDKFFHY